MMRLKSVLFTIWLYGAMAVVGIGLGPAILFRQPLSFLAGRSWARATLFGLRWIIGAKVKIEGEIPPGGPFLVAMKHQSMLDTLMPLIMFREPAIVLKRELLKAPVFGWYLSRMRMVPVDRDGAAASLKFMMRAARAAIADKRDVVIFPEGTRTEPGAPPDYKIGVAALYRDLGVPCLPIALDTSRVWSARGIDRRPGVTTIRVLDLIPAGLSKDAFMRVLEERIESETAKLLAAEPRKTA
jgi:1-acyl-sn-glycerol-3-phosphate acyltransferase